jgi:hypothetical protein
MKWTTGTPNAGLNLIKKKEPIKKEQFTLLDILVMLSALFVIIFFVYLIINPGKRGSDKRNTQRAGDIETIISLLSSYIEKEGEIPENIPEGENCMQYGHEICKSGPSDCAGLVNLSYLVETENEGEQVLSLPEDPMVSASNGTGYYIVQDGGGYITVCAPNAERKVEISLKKYMY